MTHLSTGNRQQPAESHAPAVTRLINSPHHIVVASSLADERTRVLKHGDTFAVFDHYGDIKPGGLGEEGLYHEGTRYFILLRARIGRRPAVLPGFDGPRRE